METLKLLSEAQEEENHLRRRLTHIRSTEFNSRKEFLETKAKLQKRFDEVTRKRTTLQQEYDMQIKEEKIARTKTFIQKHIDRLVIQKDNTILPINKDALTVTVQFTDCKHRKNFSLNDLIPFEQERLWQDTIDGGIHTTRKNCEACRKEKETRLAKLRRYNHEPIGHADLIIRGLR